MENMSRTKSACEWAWRSFVKPMLLTMCAPLAKSSWLTSGTTASRSMEPASVMWGLSSKSSAPVIRREVSLPRLAHSRDWSATIHSTKAFSASLNLATTPPMIASEAARRAS